MTIKNFIYEAERRFHNRYTNVPGMALKNVPDVLFLLLSDGSIGEVVLLNKDKERLLANKNKAALDVVPFLKEKLEAEYMHVVCVAWKKLVIQKVKNENGEEVTTRGLCLVFESLEGTVVKCVELTFKDTFNPCIKVSRLGKEIKLTNTASFEHKFHELLTAHKPTLENHDICWEKGDAVTTFSFEFYDN